MNFTVKMISLVSNLTKKTYNWYFDYLICYQQSFHFVRNDKGSTKKCHNIFTASVMQLAAVLVDLKRLFLLDSDSLSKYKPRPRSSSHMDPTQIQQPGDHLFTLKKLTTTAKKFRTFVKVHGNILRIP